MRCPRCSESPSALEFVGHVERVHFGHGAVRWACHHCHYQSPSFNDAIAHCLLHNHDPQALRMVAPDEIMALANRALMMNSGNVSPTNIFAPIVPEPVRLFSDSIATNMPEWENGIQSEIPQSLPPSYSENRSTRKRKRRRRSSAAEPKLQELPETQESQLAPEMMSEEEEAAEKEEEAEVALNSYEETQIESGSDSKDDFRVDCRRCSASIKIIPKSRTLNISQHVISCLRMRPYACSECPYLTSRKTYAIAHISKTHPDSQATVHLPNKERDEQIFRAGISECFPNYPDYDVSQWKGF